jgi:hypothetical protein
MNPAPEAPQKWALLIGINSYPSFARRGQLAGCINDIEAMRQVLTDPVNFSESRVASLTDAQAALAALFGRGGGGPGM